MWITVLGVIAGAAMAVLLIRLGSWSTAPDRSAIEARQAREIDDLHQQLAELLERAQEINAANSAQRTHDWAAGR